MKKLLYTAILSLTSATALYADPIATATVRGGHDGHPMSVSLVADGVNIDSIVSPWAGVFMPLNCLYPECFPGMTVELDVRYGVTDLEVWWAGALAIPAAFTGGVLTAPMILTAWTNTTELNGEGLATISLLAREDGSLMVTDLAYDLGQNPEPATLLLIATGVGVLAVRRRRG